MGEPAMSGRHRFTWADYQAWQGDERWEIIGGDAFMMSPAPTTRHQIISSGLQRQLSNYFSGRPCRVFAAPTDVLLSDEDVVQPDLLVACEPSQILRTHIAGPPALAVEILSPSTALKDRVLKLQLYARAGVKEFWIVTPFPSTVEVLLLGPGGRYEVRAVYGKDQDLESPSFPELKIPLAEVFDFPLEPGEEPPAVREPPPKAGYRAG